MRVRVYVLRAKSNKFISVPVSGAGEGAREGDGVCPCNTKENCCSSVCQ